MTEWVEVRPQQAKAMRDALDDLERAERDRRGAQALADAVCAGALAGLVPDGAAVVDVDAASGRVTFAAPEGGA